MSKLFPTMKVRRVKIPKERHHNKELALVITRNGKRVEDGNSVVFGMVKKMWLAEILQH